MFTFPIVHSFISFNVFKFVVYEAMLVIAEVEMLATWPPVEKSGMTPWAYEQTAIVNSRGGCLVKEV